MSGVLAFKKLVSFADYHLGREWRFRSLEVALSHVLPEASLQAFLVSFADYGFFVSWQRMEIPLP
jgi:hypothetical protein